MNAVLLHELSYSYGSRKALSNLHMKIHPGECVALLGPNGAGKSTLLQLLTGQLPLQKGQLEIFGSPPSSALAATEVGYSPQEIEFPKNLKVLEILKWVQAHRQNGSISSLESLLSTFQLEGLLSRKCQQLSGGEKKRLSLACAFLGSPSLVILDEPTNHLDLQARMNFSNFLKSEKTKGTSILFASHYMAEVEEMADRIFILHQGHLLQDTTPAMICEKWGIHKIQFHAPGLNLLEENDQLNSFVDQWQTQKEYHTIWSHQPDHFVRQLVLKNIEFSKLQIEKANLDDVIKTLYEQAVPL